jgi:hypothetical protein
MSFTSPFVDLSEASASQEASSKKSRDKTLATVHICHLPAGSIQGTAARYDEKRLLGSTEDYLNICDKMPWQDFCIQAQAVAQVHFLKDAAKQRGGSIKAVVKTKVGDNGNLVVIHELNWVSLRDHVSGLFSSQTPPAFEMWFEIEGVGSSSVETREGKATATVDVTASEHAPPPTYEKATQKDDGKKRLGFTAKPLAVFRGDTP